MLPQSYVSLIAGTQTLLEFQSSEDLLGFSRGFGLRDITNTQNGRAATRCTRHGALWCSPGHVALASPELTTDNGAEAPKINKRAFEQPADSLWAASKCNSKRPCRKDRTAAECMLEQQAGAVPEQAGKQAEQGTVQLLQHSGNCPCSEQQQHDKQVFAHTALQHGLRPGAHLAQQQYMPSRQADNSCFVGAMHDGQYPPAQHFHHHHQQQQQQPDEHPHAAAKPAGVGPPHQATASRPKKQSRLSAAIQELLGSSSGNAVAVTPREAAAALRDPEALQLSAAAGTGSQTVGAPSRQKGSTGGIMCYNSVPDEDFTAAIQAAVNPSPVPDVVEQQEQQQQQVPQVLFYTTCVPATVYPDDDSSSQLYQLPSPAAQQGAVSFNQAAMPLAGAAGLQCPPPCWAASVSPAAAAARSAATPAPHNAVPGMGRPDSLGAQSLPDLWLPHSCAVVPATVYPDTCADCDVVDCCPPCSVAPPPPPLIQPPQPGTAGLSCLAAARAAAAAPAASPTPPAAGLAVTAARVPARAAAGPLAAHDQAAALEIRQAVVCEGACLPSSTAPVVHAATHDEAPGVDDDVAAAAAGPGIRSLLVLQRTRELTVDTIAGLSDCAQSDAAVPPCPASPVDHQVPASISVHQQLQQQQQPWWWWQAHQAQQQLHSQHISNDSGSQGNCHELLPDCRTATFGAAAARTVSNSASKSSCNKSDISSHHNAVDVVGSAAHGTMNFSTGHQYGVRLLQAREPRGLVTSVHSFCKTAQGSGGHLCLDDEDTQPQPHAQGWTPHSEALHCWGQQQQQQHQTQQCQPSLALPHPGLLKLQSAGASSGPLHQQRHQQEQIDVTVHGVACAEAGMHVQQAAAAAAASGVDVAVCGGWNSSARGDMPMAGGAGALTSQAEQTVVAATAVAMASGSAGRRGDPARGTLLAADSTPTQARHDACRLGYSPACTARACADTSAAVQAHNAGSKRSAAAAAKSCSSAADSCSRWHVGGRRRVLGSKAAAGKSGPLVSCWRLAGYTV